MRALNKEPGNRFPNVQEFAFALEQAALLTNTSLTSRNGSSAIGELTQPMSEPLSPHQPTQANTTAKFLPNVDETDNKVMKLLCDAALANHHYWVNSADLVNQAEAMSIPLTEFHDALRILQQKRLPRTQISNGRQYWTRQASLPRL